MKNMNRRVSAASEIVKHTPLWTLIAAVGVRLLFIVHNVFTVWRLVVAHGDSSYWALLLTSLMIVIEGVIVIKLNGGTEWKWWCPCLLAYLAATMPSLWSLQLTIKLDTVQVPVGEVGSYTNSTAPLQSTSTAGTTTRPQNETFFESVFYGFNNLGQTTWIIMLQEALIYFIVLGRWLLPRNDLSRMALSELLFEFLGKACDIMELYALFDIEEIRTDVANTYLVLIIWSISFLQFIPVLKNKQTYRSVKSAQLPCIQRACGDYFAEIAMAFMAFFLQDGPFLCLRMYIIVTLRIITYSLAFFTLKNILTIMLLVYRLIVLFAKTPCCACRRQPSNFDNNV